MQVDDLAMGLGAVSDEDEEAPVSRNQVVGDESGDPRVQWLAPPLRVGSRHVQAGSSELVLERGGVQSVASSVLGSRFSLSARPSSTLQRDFLGPRR